MSKTTNYSTLQANVFPKAETLENISQMQQFHSEKLKLCGEELLQLKKFHSDYEHLQQRLITLPDKTSYDVMVPFGSLAFMPGYLIHTNEVLVLLGDNWFAERSAKQAVNIVNRRIGECAEKLKSAERSLKIHQNIIKEAFELSQASEDTVEILEEVNLEDYKNMKAEHKAHVAAYRAKIQMAEKDKDIDPASRIINVSQGDQQSFEDIMHRLEELELEEERRGEMRQDFEDSKESSSGEASESEDLEESIDSTEDEEEKDNSLNKKFKENTNDDFKKERIKRRVSWADDFATMCTVIPDDTSEDILRIKYTPSSLNFSCEKNTNNWTKENNKSNILIFSPSDIYKEFSGVSEDLPPRGILKKSVKGEIVGWRNESESVKIVTEYFEEPLNSPALETVHQDPIQVPQSVEPAFNYCVVAREVKESSQLEETSTHSSMEIPLNKNSEPKKFSFFKTSRMKNKS